MPCSKALTQLPAACSTVPLVLQAMGSCLKTKLAYLRPEPRPRYCFKEITSLVSFLSSPQKAKRGPFLRRHHYRKQFSLTGDSATVISDRLVTSWTSRSNSESDTRPSSTQARISKKKEDDQNHHPVQVSPHTRVGWTK